MSYVKVYPVIHHLDVVRTYDEVSIAFECGADGIFLISHDGKDSEICHLAKELKIKYPNKKIGINLLQSDDHLAFEVAVHFNLDMVWSDFCGVTSKGLNRRAQQLSTMIENRKDIDFFASVAFKYQATELDPARAAIEALNAGFIPTTSGSATGVAADLDKVKIMSEASNGLLAIASGIDYNNVLEYTPYVSHILVSSGVSKDFYHIDYEKLRSLIGRVRANEV